jgi:hypothetical protein
VSTVADEIMPQRAPFLHQAACLRLLSRFMAEPAELRRVMGGGASDTAAGDRQAVERLAGALWGVFSHDRVVVDGCGRRYHLGPWRAAAESIADVANGSYPAIEPPIRYVDCYVAVLTGDERRPGSRPLYHWIFSILKDAGCDWIYSMRGGAAPEERSLQMRQVSAVLSRAYEDNEGLYAPLPGIIAAYRDVYGKVPEGWIL